jgi:hypothetical protein
VAGSSTGDFILKVGGSSVWEGAKNELSYEQCVVDFVFLLTCIPLARSGVLRQQQREI